MTLLGIMREQAGGELRELLVIASVAAAANAFVFGLILWAIHDPTDVGLRELIMMLLALLLYVLSNRRVITRSLTLLEQALHRIRMRTARKLVLAELDTLERVETSEIADRLTECLRVLSDHACRGPATVQAALVIVGVVGYIAWQYPLVLLLILGLVILGSVIHLSMTAVFVQAVKRTQLLRVALLGRLLDLLAGFKQLKLDARARRDLQADIRATSAQTREAGVESSMLLAESMMLTGALVYVLLGVIAFVLGELTILAHQQLVELLATAMYLRKPTSTLVAGLFPIKQTSVQLAMVEELEAKLDRRVHASELRKQPHDPWTEPPTQLRADALAYRYDGPDAESFALGPLGLELGAGAIVFVVGGNGSGKSTLFKLLAALYRPSAGSLTLDGVEVTPDNTLAYRERISAVFGDFHLFERLYGLPEIDAHAVRERLAELDIDGVTDFVDGAFTRLDLSTGQRKRLAMVVTLLEDRPIVLLDEWAADQDPPARRRFYELLLPRLRAAGKIVVAISHDDRYFALADRVVTLDEGRIRSITSPASAQRGAET